MSPDRESEFVGPWSHEAESDPRWSDETGLLAREIIARHLRVDGSRPTLRAFVAEVRQANGKIANEHKSALYAFAVAPGVPTEADLDDDTHDYPNGFPGLTERLEGANDLAQIEIEIED